MKMGIFKLIEKRNKKDEPDQEYIIRQTDDFNDGMMRMYSQERYIINENKIIIDIKKGVDYRTKNENGSYTKVELDKREGVDYISSIDNETKEDNLSNLEKY